MPILPWPRVSSRLTARARHSHEARPARNPQWCPPSSCLSSAPSPPLAPSRAGHFSGSKLEQVAHRRPWPTSTSLSIATSPCALFYRPLLARRSGPRSALSCARRAPCSLLHADATCSSSLYREHPFPLLSVWRRSPRGALKRLASSTWPEISLSKLDACPRWSRAVSIPCLASRAPSWP
jgi:hypothetical protein